MKRNKVKKEKKSLYISCKVKAGKYLHKTNKIKAKLVSALAFGMLPISLVLIPAILLTIILNLPAASAAFVDDGSAAQILYDCGQLTTADAVYTMNQSINISGTCLNVRANNITINCQGYLINYSQAGATVGYGINSSAGYNFTTINDCVITEGRATTANKYPIYFLRSNNGTINNNTITTIGASLGIYLWVSSSGTVSNNTITSSASSAFGILLNIGADNNFVFNNTITTSGAGAYGIYLATSTKNNLTHNKVNSSQTSSYFLSGTGIAVYNNSIDSSNLAEGMPVNYTFNAGNLNFNSIDFTQYGQVIFAWSRNITITNSNFSDDSLNLFNTNTSTISNNNLTTSKGYGIFLSSNSNLNTLLNNTVTTSGSTGYGIYLVTDSNSNTLSNNIITAKGTDGYGIILNTRSNSNTILNNTVITSGVRGYGIYLVTNSNSNTLSNNTITTSGSTGYGIILNSGSTNNSFSGMRVITNNTLAYALYLIVGSHNFTMQDSVLNSSRAGVNDFNMTSGVNAIKGGIFNFTNVTRADSSAITIGWPSGSNGTLNMHWYLGVNVTSSNAPVNEANVTSYNFSGNTMFSEITGANGLTLNYPLLSFIMTNNTAGGTITTYSEPYTVNATKTGYTDFTNSTINLTTNIYLFDVILSSSDSCTCAGSGNNWEIDMSDECVISAACDLGAGNITFIGTGTTTFNATILSGNLEYPATGQILNISSIAIVTIG